MRVAIFGAGGLLGRALARAGAAAGDEVFAFSHAECDIADERAVGTALARAPVAVVFNAAAMTDVDRCEIEREAARRANQDGPAILAALARCAGARLLHVSTDYVFSGEKDGPYAEPDPPGPLNWYGETKRAGEQAVLDADPRHVVVRTAWLYGPGGKSFVARIPEILRARGEIAAIEDQRGSPTAVSELAPLLCALARRASGGIYHAAGRGAASYFEIAREAARALGLPDACVRPLRASEVPRPAPRPRATPLISVRLEAEGFPPLRPWAESYRAFLRGA